MEHFTTKRGYELASWVLICLAIVPWTAGAQTPVITSVPAIVPAGPDFATDRLGNPWDFSDPFDVSPFPDELGGWTISPTTGRTVGRSAFLSGGRFVGRTDTSGNNLVPLLYRGGVDFITSAHENSGAFDHKAIPTGLYGKLAVAMTLSAQTGGQLAAFWYATPYGSIPAALGVGFRTPQAGTHIYIVDLETGVWTDARGTPAQGPFLPISGYPVPWTSTPLMRGLQLRPTSSGSAVDVQVDWVRLTQRDGFSGAAALPVTFSGCAGREYSVEVMASANVWDVIHTGTAGASTITANVNHGVLPPGTWSFRVGCYPSGRTSAANYSQPFSVSINAPPVVNVHNPDATGGADWATTVRGDAWDMNALSDINQYFHVANPAIVFDGVTNAVQGTSDSTGDPALVFLYGQTTIDTSRFRNLTFALTLDTPFSLDPPGGSVARVFFERVTGAGSTLSVSQDILVWPGRNVYTVDLATLTQSNGGLEPDCACPNLPWAAAPVRYFRIDPHESSIGLTFRLGPVLLTAHDEAPLGVGFPVQYSFSDADTSGSTYQARIYIDNDREGSARALIDTVTSGVVPNSVLTYNLDPARFGMPPGDYYVFVEIVESRAGFNDVRGRYSSGPLRASAGVTGSAPPGAPTLVPVQTSSNPVTIAWSPGSGGAPTSYTVVVGSSPGAADLLVANVGMQTQVSGNAPPGFPIYVRVVASNGVGAAVSNEITIVAGGSSIPARPTMGAANVVGRTVGLSWAASAGPPPAYYVLIARIPGNPTPIVTFPTTQTSLTVGGVPPGTYILSVIAVNGAGPSPESAPIGVTVQ